MSYRLHPLVSGAQATRSSVGAQDGRQIASSVFEPHLAPLEPQVATTHHQTKPSRTSGWNHERGLHHSLGPSDPQMSSVVERDQSLISSAFFITDGDEGRLPNQWQPHKPEATT